MKLEFDPMTEAAAVRRMLDALLGQDVKADPAYPTLDNLKPNPGRHVVQRAVPLYPAPCTAAADVFPTAPGAPTAGEASAPPVPPPPVPTIPVPAAPSAPAAGTSPVVVDKNGLPWDERIHSGTKAQNADGSWRQRRGLNNPEYVAGIEAELRAALAIPVPAAPVSAVPLPPANTANTAGGAASSSSTTDGTAVSVFTATVPAPPVPPTPQTAPQETHGASTAAGTSEVPNAAPASSPAPTAPIPTPPVPPVPTAPAGTATPISFAQVMSKVTEAVRTGKVSEADVHGALAAVGLGPNEIGKLAKQDEATAGHRQTVATILDDIAGGA